LIERWPGHKHSSFQPWFRGAHACLAAGDVEKYRHYCRVMLQRFGHRLEFDVCTQLAEVCLLLPQPTGGGPGGGSPALDVRRLAGVARRAAEGPQAGPGRPWFDLVLGMAEYRLGRYEHAIPHLAKARRARAADAHVKVLCDLFLAMTHHRVGREHEARQLLVRAVEVMETRVKKVGGSGDLGAGFNEPVACHVVRQEAEALIGRAGRGTVPLTAGAIESVVPAARFELGTARLGSPPGRTTEP